MFRSLLYLLITASVVSCIQKEMGEKTEKLPTAEQYEPKEPKVLNFNDLNAKMLLVVLKFDLQSLKFHRTLQQLLRSIQIQNGAEKKWTFFITSKNVLKKL